MKELIWGMIGSFLIYLALPDVGLTKPQTVLILIVGCGICTSAIWWIEDIAERRQQKRKGERFREFLNRTTL